MGAKRVTDKRFGLKNYLIENLRRFQLSLKLHRKMSLVRDANVICNNGPEDQLSVASREKRQSHRPRFHQDFTPQDSNCRLSIK